MAVHTTLLELGAPDILLDFFEYWRGKRQVGGLVDRDDIDPIEMRAFLPNLFICHREDDRIHYDLVGTEVVRAHGREVRGLCLDEIVSAERYEELSPVFMTAIDGRIVYQHGAMNAGGREHVVFDRLMLPMTYRKHQAIIGMNAYRRVGSAEWEAWSDNWAEIIHASDGARIKRVTLSSSLTPHQRSTDTGW